MKLIRKEKQKTIFILLLLSFVYLLLTSLPYWSGYWHCPEGAVFIGHPEPFDFNGIIGFMQGAKNIRSPLFINLFTTEPHNPVLFYPFHPFFGWLAQIFHTEAMTMFNLERILFTLIFVFTSFKLARIFFTVRSKCFFALLLILLSGGWGNWFLTEAHTMMSISFFPHFSFALILYELIIIAMLSHRMRNSIRAITLFFCSFLLAFNHPFSLLPLSLLLTVYLFIIFIYYKKKLFAVLVGVISFLIGAVIPSVYYLFLIKANFMVKIYGEQNVLFLKGGVISWLKLLNLSLFFALPSLPYLFLCRTPKRIFIFLWVIIGFSSLLLPLPFQRRVVEGLPIGLSIATTETLWLVILPAIFKAIRRGLILFKKKWHIFKNLSLIIVLLLLIPKTINFLKHFSAEIYSPPTTLYYISAEEYEALQWLKAQPDWEDAVWASFQRGNTIPHLTTHRTFFGHTPSTLHFGRKKQLTNRLFRSKLLPEEFKHLIQQNKIKYIYVGRCEKDYYGAEVAKELLFTYPDLTTVFKNNQVVIFSP